MNNVTGCFWAILKGKYGRNFILVLLSNNNENSWDITCSKKVRFQSWLTLAQYLLIEFLGSPSLASIISDNSQSTLGILVPILLRISWILWNIPKFFILHGFEGSYGHLMKKIRYQKICLFEPTLKSNLFEHAISHVIFHGYGSRAPKWNYAHINQNKQPKNTRKTPKIVSLLLICFCRLPANTL